MPFFRPLENDTEKLRKKSSWFERHFDEIQSKKYSIDRNTFDTQNTLRSRNETICKNNQNSKKIYKNYQNTKIAATLQKVQNMLQNHEKFSCEERLNCFKNVKRLIGDTSTDIAKLSLALSQGGPIGPGSNVPSMGPGCPIGPLGPGPNVPSMGPGGPMLGPYELPEEPLGPYMNTPPMKKVYGSMWPMYNPGPGLLGPYGPNIRSNGPMNMYFPQLNHMHKYPTSEFQARHSQF